jgi:hypothetical protein
MSTAPEHDDLVTIALKMLIRAELAGHERRRRRGGPGSWIYQVMRIDQAHNPPRQLTQRVFTTLGNAQKCRDDLNRFHGSNTVHFEVMSMQLEG